MKAFLLTMSWLVLCFNSAKAADAVSTNGVRFAFIDPTTPPTTDWIQSIHNAIRMPIPDTSDHHQDTFDHGALSNVVSSSIESITVRWADTNTFKSHGDIEATVRGLFTAAGSYVPVGSGVHSGCQTFAFYPWQQMMIPPKLAATVKHQNGKQGQFLLFNRDMYGYQDQDGKWWWGICGRH